LASSKVIIKRPDGKEVPLEVLAHNRPPPSPAGVGNRRPLSAYGERAGHEAENPGRENEGQEGKRMKRHVEAEVRKKKEAAGGQYRRLTRRRGAHRRRNGFRIGFPKTADLEPMAITSPKFEDRPAVVDE
jgi:hypothetical protein